MKKVRCISSWSESYPLHIRIIEQFAPDYERQNKIRFVDGNDYDYLVIFNDAKGFKPNLSPSKILGFIQEPPDHNKYFDIDLDDWCGKTYTCADWTEYQFQIGKIYKGFDNNAYTAPAAMFYSMSGRIEDYLNYKDFNKPKKISLVMSGIRGGFYETRHEVLKKILDSDLDIDIYGRDLNITDQRYKGAPQNKAEALLPYEYSIAIENGRWKGYISEKFFDCLLCNTVPIYLGAPDLLQYFSPEVAVSLPNINDSFIPALKSLINSKPHRNRNSAILEAKLQWHKKYNIFNLIKDFVL